MSHYVLMLQPSANRVYTSAAPRLAAAELQICLPVATKVTDEQVGGVAYLGFDAEPLDDGARRALGLLSAGYALFERRGDALLPIELPSPNRLPDDLLTIPKYVGKTNEQFTKLLLNVTVLNTAWASEIFDRRLTVLDPLCGRGTTLNQAIMYGHHAVGVDSDQKAIAAYAQFLGTWLKTHRMKHRIDYAPVRDHGKVIARRLDAALGESKDAYREGDVIEVTAVAADTTDAPRFVRAGSVDVVVTDLPYGVQHGSRSGAGARARSPLALVQEAVSGWVSLMRPGAALGVSWNTHTLRRTDLADTLSAAGLVVVDDAPYAAFTHRVDASITRDLLIARREASPASRTSR